MRHGLALTTTIENYLTTDPRTLNMPDEVRATLAAQIAAALIDQNPIAKTSDIHFAIEAWLSRCAYL